MTALEAAREYRELGWAPIPVPAKAKKPALDGWQRLKLADADLPRHFASNPNVGLLVGEPSGGLVDVDLDCPAAVAVAASFLPSTPLWSGHEKRPRSHAWFRCAEVPKAARYKDPTDNATVAELRSTGGQTVVAPSTHPEGGAYLWHGPLRPAEVGGPDLDRAVRALAAAALLAKHWPQKSGSRHDIANALAGMLARAKWSDADVAGFVLAVAAGAGDEEAEGRRDAAKATAERYRTGGYRITGTKTLAGLIDPRVVSRVRMWLGLGGFDAVEVTEIAEPEPVEIVRASDAEIPDACYRGIFRDFRDALAETTEACDNYRFATFLTYAGALIGRRCYYRHATRLYPNFYTVVVGDSGFERKTSSVRWGASALPDGADIETLETGSWEGILDVLGEHKGRRVLLRPAEFRTLASKAKQDALSNLIPGLTELYDCPDRYRHKTRGVDRAAELPFLSIVTASTREWFQSSVSEDDVHGGFLNRWILVDGKRTAVIPRPAEPEPGPWGEVRQALMNLDRRLARAPEGVGFGIEMHRDAEPLWDSFYCEMLGWKFDNDVLARMAQRIQDHVLKLALVYAALDGDDFIRPDNLEAALAFGRWLRGAHRRVFLGYHESPLAKLERRILTNLARLAPENWTPRAALHRTLGGRVSSDELNRALRGLVVGGYVAERSASRGDGWVLQLTAQGRQRAATVGERVGG